MEKATIHGILKLSNLKQAVQLYPFLIITLIALTCCKSAEDKNKAQSKPNIIYILVDDLGYGDIGSYGQKILKTPCLDRMAAEGMRFTQHYAGAPVCAPSRVALMTGLHTGHSYVRGNYETGKYGFGGQLELRTEDVTVAEVLKKEGYSTAVIGKWGMGMDGSTGEPNKQGFDYSYGFLNQAHAHWQFPEYLFRNGKKETVDRNKGGERSYFTNDIFTHDALKFIQQKREAPFFLYLSYVTPHAELLVPEDSIFAVYKGKFNEIPFVAEGQGSSRTDSLGYYHSQAFPKAAYAAMITRIDMDVNKILQQLKHSGLDENTVVMFSSDNGPHKEGGANPEYFDSNGPFRGMKRDLYEGGIRVPFIVRWPGKIKAGQVTHHLSAFWDVFPTMADLAGADETGLNTDGHSLLPTFLGDTANQKKHAYLYWEFHERKYSDQAVRKDHWKAVRRDPSSPVELYNLATDTSEQKNVASEHQILVEEMETIMEKARTENPYWKLKASAE